MIIKKIITLVFFTFIFLTVRAQIFKPIGNGIHYDVLSSCFDSKGNITIIYNPIGDSAHIDIFNQQTKKWSNYNKFKNNIYPAMSSIYKNDSLYIYGSLNGSIGLFYVNKTTIKRIGNFSPLSYKVDLNIFRNKITVSGYFDTIFDPINSTNVFSSRMAFYNGKYWEKSNFTNTKINISTDINNELTYVNKDTMLFSNGNDLYKYTYPNNWINLKNKKNITGITSSGSNEYLFANYSDDSLFALSGNQVKLKFKTQIPKSRASTNSLIKHKSNVFYWGNKFLYRLKSNKFEKVILLDTFDSQFGSYPLISNDTHFYIGNVTSFNYKNIKYGKFDELITDSLKELEYDTIIGFVFWDKNNNRVRDAGDLDVPSYANIDNKTYGNGNGKFALNGRYEELVPNYNNVEYHLTSFQTDTCLKLPFSAGIMTKNMNAGVTKDTFFFPLVRTSLVNESNLEVKAYSRASMRLLDSNTFYFDFYNKTCEFSYPDLTAQIKIDSNYTITGIYPNYTSRNGNTLNFNITELYNFQKQQIQVKGYYSNTKYSLGNTVKHYVKIKPSITEDTTDNIDTIVQNIVYSYDPNSKQSYPEGRITSELKKIRYTINFQNEGNDDARRVTIVDTLNLKMPVYEFQMVGATHPYSVSIQPGTSVVTWTFDNINLKPKEQNEALSKGYLVFDAKVRGDLRMGDSIRNKAYIYFDYNTPIITNYAVIHKRDESSNIESKIVSNNLILYPNPSSNFITIKSKIDNQDITIYDMKGASIKTIKININNKSIIDVSQWAKGIYLLVSESGESLKFIVE